MRVILPIEVVKENTPTICKGDNLNEMINLFPSDRIRLDNIKKQTKIKRIGHAIYKITAKCTFSEKDLATLDCNGFTVVVLGPDARRSKRKLKVGKYYTTTGEFRIEDGYDEELCYRGIKKPYPKLVYTYKVEMILGNSTELDTSWFTASDGEEIGFSILNFQEDSKVEEYDRLEFSMREREFILDLSLVE